MQHIRTQWAINLSIGKVTVAKHDYCRDAILRIKMQYSHAIICVQKYIPFFKNGFNMN